MSFLYRSSTLLASRTATHTPAATRCFSVATVYRKGPVETAKEGLKKVDRVVSDAAVKGIDAGVEAKNKAASIAGVKAEEAKGAAEEKAGEVKGKAAEVKGEAIGKKEEIKGEAIGKKEEIKRKV